MFSWDAFLSGMVFSAGVNMDSKIVICRISGGFWLFNSSCYFVGLFIMRRSLYTDFQKMPFTMDLLRPRHTWRYRINIYIYIYLEVVFLSKIEHNTRLDILASWCDGFWSLDFEHCWWGPRGKERWATGSIFHSCPYMSPFKKSSCPLSKINQRYKKKCFLKKERLDRNLWHQGSEVGLVRGSWFYMHPF